MVEGGGVPEPWGQGHGTEAGNLEELAKLPEQRGREEMPRFVPSSPLLAHYRAQGSDPAGSQLTWKSETCSL